MSQDPYRSSVVLHLPFNGADGSTTFTDFATGKTVTANGNAQIDDAQSKFGGTSLKLDGSGDYLSLADSADWAFGSGDFTIEFWYKFNTVPADLQFLYNQHADAGANLVEIYFSAVSTIVFNSTISGSQGPKVTASGITHDNTTWHHLAVTRNGSSWTIWLDGTSVGTHTSSTALADVSSPLAIGRWEGDGYYFNGWVDDYRVTKGVARYTSTFTPPSQILAFDGDLAGTVGVTSTLNGNAGTPDDANVVLFLPFNESDGSTAARDNSTRFGHTLSFYGNAQLDDAQLLCSETALLLDGTGDYISIPASSDWNFGTGNFQVEAHIRPNAFTADDVIACSYAGSWPGTAMSFYLATRSGSPNILIFRGGIADSAIQIVLSGNTALSTNTWAHVAVSRVSGVTRLFVNGVLQSATDTGNDTLDSNVAVRIGRNFQSVEGDGEYFNGRIKNLRIRKGGAVGYYTATFTPPSCYSGSLAGTVSLSSTLEGEFTAGIQGTLAGTVELSSSLEGIYSFVGDLSADVAILAELSGYGNSVDGLLESVVSVESQDFVAEVTIVGSLEGTIELSSSLDALFGFFGPLSSSVSVSAVLSGVSGAKEIDDSCAFASTMQSELRLLLRDNFTLSLLQTHSALLWQEIEDDFLFADLVKAIHQARLVEGIIFSEDVLGIMTWIASLEELLSFNLVQGHSASFVQSLISAAILSDVLSLIDIREISDSAGFADNVSAIAALLGGIVDSMLLADTLSNQFIAWRTLSDELVLSEVLDWNATWQAILEDDIVLSGQITVDGVDYVAWVLNPSNKAFSSYSNFPFNSFVQLENEAFGIADDGIYAIEGSDDDGEDINNRLRFGLMDFGSALWKNVRHAYLGLVSGGESLRLRTVAMRDGQREQDEYILRPKQGTSAFELRGNFSNAIQARYWSFEIENIEGASLEIESVEFGVILLPRRK